MTMRFVHVRVVFAALLIGFLAFSIGVVPSTEEVAAAEPAVEFARIVDGSALLPPVFGPTAADLPFEAWENCPECSLAAGVSLSDVHVHLEFDPLEPDLPGGFFLSIRQANPQHLDILGANFVTAMDGTWLVGGMPVQVSGSPQSVDVIAIGGQGYLGIDGQLRTTFDLSGIQDPGDVVLTAGMLVDYPGSTFGVNNFTVWDLGAAQSDSGKSTSQVPSSSAETFDAYRQMAARQPILYGPASGTIGHDPETVLFVSTDVTVSDFSARIVCQEPVPLTDGPWDCGFAFRDITNANYFAVGVATDGRWFVSTGSGLPIGEGTVPPGVMTSNAFLVELIVVGPTGYLGVNDVFVAELDLSAIPGPGTVAAATAFFGSTSIPGGETLYENFTVTSLDASAAPTSDQAPVDGGPVINSSVIAGNTYTSPTFGYSLTWDQSWTVLNEGSDGYDFLTLTNGEVLADFYSIDLDVDATACNEDLFNFYQADPQFSNVTYLLDASGNPMVYPGTEHASAWIGFTYTDSSGVAAEYYELDVCVRMPNGSTMVQFEFQVTPADAEANLVAIEQLVAGLDFGLLNNPILDVKSG